MLDKLKRIDFIIVLILICFMIISTLAIYSATFDTIYTGFHKQHLKMFIVFMLMIPAMVLIDYRIYLQFAHIIYVIGIGLLIWVMVDGVDLNGAVRWIKIAGMQFQPSELVKLSTILLLAKLLSKREGAPLELKKDLIPLTLVMLVPFVLIVLQPDLGNALVLSGVFFSIMVVTGVRLRHFAYIGAIIASGIGVLTYIYFAHSTLFFKIIKEYQWLRLTAFISNDVNTQAEGYQLFRSLIAIGSGTLQGKGVDGDTLVKNNWVPVSESDFIFSVIGETFGFIGSSILILLFFLLIYRLIRIAMTTDDLFASYVISGIIGMFVFQIFENIGMTIGIMPITGITLPFVSYGGSSLLTNMAAIGIVLGIGIRRRKLMF